MAEIELLPDEILQRIFSYFSIMERLKYESVCVRWRLLMNYRLKEIDLVETLISKNKLKTADTLPVTRTLHCLLKRCGEYLTKISFGKSNLLIPFTTITKIDELCQNIEHLDLSFSTVTDQIVPALMRISNRLITLDLGNTNFTIRDPNQHSANLSVLFFNMTRLENINLQRTNAQNLLAVLHLPDTLKSLNLNACSPLSPEVLFQVIVKCYDLEDLRLSAYSRMNYNIVQAICTLPRLRILDISRQSGQLAVSTADGGNWKNLSRVNTLQELYAQYNSSMTEYVLEQITGHCPDFRVLNVSYCCGISTFIPWLANLTHLTAFYVAANDAFSDIDMNVLVQQNGSTLHTLHTPCCPSVTGEGLKSVAKYCPNLIDLNMGQCEEIGDESVEMVFRECKKLEKVDLRASAISDALFQKILITETSEKGDILDKLYSLDISYCRGITDDGINDLCKLLMQNGGNRKERTIVYVHQSRVTRGALVNLMDCPSVVVQL